MGATTKHRRSCWHPLDYCKPQRVSPRSSGRERDPGEDYYATSLVVVGVCGVVLVWWPRIVAYFVI